MTSSMRVRGRVCNNVKDDSQSIHGDTQTNLVLCNVVPDTTNTPCRYSESLKTAFLFGALNFERPQENSSNRKQEKQIFLEPI